MPDYFIVCVVSGIFMFKISSINVHAFNNNVDVKDPGNMAKRQLTSLRIEPYKVSILKTMGTLAHAMLIERESIQILIFLHEGCTPLNELSI